MYGTDTHTYRLHQVTDETDAQRFSGQADPGEWVLTLDVGRGQQYAGYGYVWGRQTTLTAEQAEQAAREATSGVFGRPTVTPDGADWRLS